MGTPCGCYRLDSVESNYERAQIYPAVAVVVAVVAFLKLTRNKHESTFRVTVFAPNHFQLPTRFSLSFVWKYSKEFYLRTQCEQVFC